MDHEQLRSDLQKLHSELGNIKSLDDDEQRLLRQLEADIEALLSRDKDNMEPDEDLRQRLTEALAHVEASHPRITLLLRQIVDSLSFLGV
jgi:predicted  nucleic acid-binding Zn-ribbon protein